MLVFNIDGSSGVCFTSVVSWRGGGWWTNSKPTRAACRPPANQSRARGQEGELRAKKNFSFVCFSVGASKQ